MSKPVQLQRLIRLKELPTYVGLRKSQIQYMVKNGEFPKPVKLTEKGRYQAWPEDEVIAWQQKKLAAREVA